MSSFLSSPLIAAESALASDADFLTWTGAIDAADAKANYIFSDDSKIDGDLPAKFAALTEMKDWTFTRTGMGAGDRAQTMTSSGSTQPGRRSTGFENTCGASLDGTPVP